MTKGFQGDIRNVKSDKEKGKEEESLLPLPSPNEEFMV